MPLPLWRTLLWPGTMTALVAALLALITVRFLVPRLPEPEVDPDDPFVKPLYRDLVRPGVTIPALALGGIAGGTSPLAGGMVLGALALAGLGAALSSVDAATTYLPSRLHWLTVSAVVLLGALGVLLWEPRARWWPIGLGAVFGALASLCLFWVIWRVGNGFGYGDVRLATLTGGFCGALGVKTWWTGMLLGTIVGAVCAIAVALYRRRHPSPLGTAFAYGPALWAGPFLALLMNAW